MANVKKNTIGKEISNPNDMAYILNKYMRADQDTKLKTLRTEETERLK